MGLCCDRFDYGSRQVKGGPIIDLVMEVYKMALHCQIERHSFSVHLHLFNLTPVISSPNRHNDVSAFIFLI